MPRRPLRTLVFLFLTLLAQAAAGQVTATLVASGLDEPLFATSPGLAEPLFIVERAGRIRILRAGTVLPTPFLDISDRVSVVGERGLLGLAFAPDYGSSGAFYVYYTDRSGRSQISRFFVSVDPDRATDAEQSVLTLSQPFTNHNGGTIAFGADGYLYFAPGDGGSANDPAERSQNPGVLLGKMLRLDVGPVFASGSVPVPGTGYAIPADNPFNGVSGARPEIWSLGLRNPYRFSFDRATGDLWIADVGQGRREEINFEPADDPGGRNWGWDVMEGSLCNRSDPAAAPPCNDASLSLPIFEYDRSGGNCSITGGFVAGAQPAEWSGQYVYGDFCSGRIWSFDPQTAVETEWTAALGAAGRGAFELVGFGRDGVGRLYVVHSGGDVYRVESRTECNDGLDNDGDGLVDFGEDPGCAFSSDSPEDPMCNDGRDNDGDGAIDLLDSDCRGNPAGSETILSCGLGFELAPILTAALGWRRFRRRGERVNA